MNWFVIPKFCKYEITKTGQVRHRKHKHILKQSQASNNYFQVAVYSDVLQKSITKCVHQLMAITFLGEKQIDHEISFIKKDKSNVQLSNLTYKLSKDNYVITQSPSYCVVCGAKCPRSRSKYCSDQHRFLHTHTLLQCYYCKCKFYRSNGVLRTSVKKGNKRNYCCAKHYQLSAKNR